MVKSLKSAFYVLIVGCPDGLAAGLTGLLLELGYRTCVAVEILNSGYEYFSLMAGLAAFIALFIYRAARHYIRTARSNRLS